MSARTLKTIAAALAVTAGLAVASVSAPALADLPLTMKNDAERAQPPSDEKSATAESDAQLTSQPLTAAPERKAEGKTDASSDRAVRVKRRLTRSQKQRLKRRLKRRKARRAARRYTRRR